jgi:hypothetical protein
MLLAEDVSGILGAKPRGRGRIVVLVEAAADAGDSVAHVAIARVRRLACMFILAAAAGVMRQAGILAVFVVGFVGAHGGLLFGGVPR